MVHLLGEPERNVQGVVSGEWQYTSRKGTKFAFGRMTVSFTAAGAGRAGRGVCLGSAFPLLLKKFGFLGKNFMSPTFPEPEGRVGRRRRMSERAESLEVG